MINVNIKEKMMMKIKSIKPVGKQQVYDISVADNQQYALENGIISHNTGSYYNSDNIWILGRQQEKEDGEIAGYHFVINVEKSRYVKEKSKIPITVMFDGGINKWSGLFDIALEGNYIASPKKGWYTVVNRDTGELGTNMRASDFIDSSEFWNKMFKETDFADYIKSKYTLAAGSIYSKDEMEIESE